MKNKKKYFYIKVQMLWGTITYYQLPKDLSIALQQQLDQQGEYSSILKGALINVPIIENDFQHKYHALIIPAKIKAVFVKKHKCSWRTRSQFISRKNIDFSDKNQLRFLQHDYSKFNQWLIKKCWNAWGRKEFD